MKRAQPRVNTTKKNTYIHSITPDNILITFVFCTRENIDLCLTFTPLCSLESAGSPRMKHR